MITNGFFPDPYLYTVLCLCSHFMLRIWFIWVQSKQLEWGRTAVQAEGPNAVGFCNSECRHHIHSNSSMRCLVFPDRICLRVLYLSRPAFMFSAWIMSFTVFLLSSRALANSELKAWKHSHHSINTYLTLLQYNLLIYHSNKLLIDLLNLLKIWAQTYE